MRVRRMSWSHGLKRSISVQWLNCSRADVAFLRNGSGSGIFARRRSGMRHLRLISPRSDPRALADFPDGRGSTAGHAIRRIPYNLSIPPTRCPRGCWLPLARPPRPGLCSNGHPIGRVSQPSQRDKFPEHDPHGGVRRRSADLLARLHRLARTGAGRPHPHDGFRGRRAAAVRRGQPGDCTHHGFGRHQRESAGGDGDAAGRGLDGLGLAGLGLLHGHSVWQADAPQAFAAGIATLIADPERRAQIALAAYGHAVRNFSWTAIGEKQRDLLRV